nr:MAG TPA: hypothetical protein [Caudoviricetes sp.]
MASFGGGRFLLRFSSRYAMVYPALPVTVGGWLPDRGQLLAP